MRDMGVVFNSGPRLTTPLFLILSHVTGFDYFRSPHRLLQWVLIFGKTYYINYRSLGRTVLRNTA